MKNFIAIFLVLPLLFLAGCENKKEENKQQVQNVQQQATQVQAPAENSSAAKAPDFEVNDLSGKKIRLSDYKGSVVFLDFWASWCGWCKIEIPFFSDMYNKYKDKGLVIIGIATSDRDERVSAFVNSYKMTYPVVMAKDEIVSAYGGIRGLPTTFVIDKNGNIARQYVGYRPREVFEKDYNDLK
jgi:cytochrome c biogenesis protein CcmG/thiol:disulfide interchange protein DsbE